MSDFLWQIGSSGTWIALLVCAIPVGVLGLYLRGRSRRAAGDASEAMGARRVVRDVGPGRVTIVGKWQPQAGSALVIDEPHAVKIACDVYPDIKPGTPVLVVGVATHEEATTRAAQGYRDGARVWVVDTRAPASLISTEVHHLAAALKSARRRALAGGLLFAGSIATTAIALAAALRV